MIFCVKTKEKPQEAEYGLSVASTMHGTTKAVSVGIMALGVLHYFMDPGEGSERQISILPEPFNAMDHIENLSLTYAVVGALTFKAFGEYHMRAETSEEQKRRSKIIGGAMAATTLAFNIAAEKIGWSAVSTPDALDMAYGCIGGVVGYKLARPRYNNPTEIQAFLAEGKDEAAKSTIRRAIELRNAE